MMIGGRNLKGRDHLERENECDDIFFVEVASAVDVIIIP